MKARRCPGCGRTWSDRRAEWCAGCGSSLSNPRSEGEPRELVGAPPSSPAARRRPAPLAIAAVATVVVVGALSLTGGGALLTGAGIPATPSAGTEQMGETAGSSSTVDAAAGAGTVELTAPTGQASIGGSWSPGTEPGAVAVVRSGSSFPPSGPSCDTEGCALWRSTVLNQRPLLVNDRAAIHLGLALLIAVDLDTGQWLWRRGHNDPRGVSPAAALTAHHLDDRTLVIAYGHRLRIHAAETGTVLGEVDLAPTQITDIRRHDGQLVVSGRTLDSQRPGTRMVGLDDTGRVRFDIEVARPIRQAAPATSTTAPLLAVAGGDLVRFDATEGFERWRRVVGQRQVDGTTLLDPTTGEITVVGTRDGRDLLTLERPGAVAAGIRGGVLVITYPDRLELHDRDGVALGSVATTAPERTVVDTTGRLVVVAALPAPGTADPKPSIRIGRRASGSVALPSVTESTSVPLPPDVDPAPVLAMRRPDGLLLAGPEPGWAWVMERMGGEVTDLELPLLPGTEVHHGEGLTLLRDGRQLTVLGAGGSFRVRGVTQIASLDPLVLHGGNGTLRLDRTLVDRPDDDSG